MVCDRKKHSVSVIADVSKRDLNSSIWVKLSEKEKSLWMESIRNGLSASLIKWNFSSTRNAGEKGRRSN